MALPAPPTSKTPALEGLRARYEAAASRRAAEAPWLADRRAEAMAQFEALGFPTSRHEDWKYTNVTPLSQRAWASPTPGVAPVREEELRSRLLHLHGGIALVFVNGHFSPRLSGTGVSAPGVVIGSLAQTLRQRPEVIEPLLTRLADTHEHAFTALNTALFEDGALILVPKDCCIPVPIDVLYVSTGEAGDVLAAGFPRTLIVAEPESRVTVVERHVSLGTAPYLTVPVTEIALARNAAVEHVLWQEDADSAFHVSTVAVRQARDSRFTGHALSLGAGLSRNDTVVSLTDEGAEAVINGLYVVSGSRHADHHTRIDHQAPHGTSRELYKGILDGKSTGVFNGKVYVHPGAVKTDSQQANHNLLLSPDATVDTKPELQIYNDDVKCAHGATVGRLDEDQVFYLRTRGIDEALARDILVRAFAKDVTARITIEAVRTRLDAWMEARLPSAAAKAGNGAS